MEISLKYKNKKLGVEVFSCGFFKRFSGLMFNRREKAKILLFDFKKHVRIPIHSYFVFFPFVAVWFDNKQIIDVKMIKPSRWRVCPKKSFTKIIEIPISKKFKKEIKFFGF